MNRRELVLVDTSIWIKYLRDERAPESTTMQGLLSADRIVICGPILAEILSGSKDRGSYGTIKELLSAIPCLDPAPGVWARMGETRFVLARKGIQQSLVDLWIAAVAHEYGLYVWTLDKDFERITHALSFKLFQM